ncbi:hypothetical protein K6W16_13940 [Burkholderia dolosa]|uniref:Uncharacterized protein n=1 Tax=Burkholderia dolosa TaxID=152500 RepID=A0A892I2N1_9BURK|nr:MULTISPECIES: hypothetical protein [Burkholderia]AJY13589.1 putative membrane protein [Burkholderia dolosa AU0158]MBR8418913.1 hypothetical protein [Burkholderia dolosa]MBY4658442.1 hypothetical protein [Burkholderia dolosa]MBY4689192.1 hypothetical protein [Burkholderia dolosa]MBY4781611.1 hypothetical protein [Burkholderia dolosa]
MIEAIWNSLPAKVTRCLNWIHELPLRIFIPSALLFIILKNGIWVIPNIEVLRSMASDITRNMLVNDVRGQYLYSSFFGLALAWITGAYRTTTAFAAMHFSAFIAGTIGLSIFIDRRHGQSVVKLFLIALACAPISNVILNWLGISDVFTYLFGTIIAISESVPILFLATMFLGVSHMEQGIVIAVIVITKIALIDDAHSKSRLLRILAVATGIVSAKIFFVAYFSAMNFNLTFSRAAFATPAFAYLFLSGFLRNISVTVYAFYSAAWVLVGFFINFALRSHNKRFLAFTIFANITAAATSAMVYDSTRDFTLIVWPAFVAALIYVDRKADREELRKATLLAFAACLILPKIIVWAGKMQSSALFYDFLFVAEKITRKSLIAPLDYIHIAWPFAY